MHRFLLGIGNASRVMRPVSCRAKWSGRTLEGSTARAVRGRRQGRV